MDESVELNRVFESVASYFGLLAEPARLRILNCLCGQERSVNQVVELVGLSQANTSRHLNLLYRAGVVDRRREGNSVIYRLVDPNFAHLCRTVCVQIASGGATLPGRMPSRATLMKVSQSLHTTSK